MDSPSADAGQRLASPDVPPSELAAIAAAHPELREAVAAHPSCYPGLQAWIAQVGSAAPPVAPLADPLTLAGTAPSVPSARRARLPWIVAAVAVVFALVSVGALVRVSLGESPSDEPESAATSGSDEQTPVAAPAQPPPRGPDESGTGEPGFASPEDAVAYFVASVAAGDLAGATSAFTVTSIVDRFSFEASSELSGVVAPYTWLPQYPDYRSVNEGLRRGDVARQLAIFVEHVAAPHREFLVTQKLDADLTAADLQADLAPELLSGLSVIRVDDTIGGSRPGNEFLDALGAAYGADEVREVAVLYGTGDGTVLGGVELLRFGDEWFVWNLTSHVMNTMMGALEPTSEQEYLFMLAQVQG